MSEIPFRGLDFGRDVCNDLSAAERREWLVTNGIGGYAMGTVAGLLTRCYHGLLIAALEPPLGRTLLVSKLEETAHHCGDDPYPLFANRWADGTIDPRGFEHIDRFRLEGTTPVWTFACADALLEKRIWMQVGANTSYVRYDLTRSSAPLRLRIKALVDYRDHHGRTRADGWPMQVSQVPYGLRVEAFDGAAPYFLFSGGAAISPQHQWYRGHFLAVEHYRGLDPLDDHLYAGCLEAALQPGDSLTVVISTDATPNLDGASAYSERQAYERGLLDKGRLALDVEGEDPDLQDVESLVLAADQFVVRRPVPDDPDGQSVIAGYPWFGDWGRDTMISLPGLTLATGRPEIAARILRTFGHFVDQGMLPNRFPDEGERPEYNTVDATLWYFEAIRAYRAETGDDDLPRALYPVLEEIIAWHLRGTRYGIRQDPKDGLLYAGEPGVQLTWMDAKVGDWVVTPRIGKPVEINALWYNALRTMGDLARDLGRPGDPYDDLAERAHSGFARFWNEAAGYCYDVIDGPDGDDPALRPNQLFAVSLPYSPLSEGQRRAVVDVCARYLYTPHGLRSLSPHHPAYVGRYGGGPRQRDGAYHQGTAWSWLIGPFVRAHLRVYRDPRLARSYVMPLIRQLADHGVGSISEIYDGDPPFTPRGCVAQAWSVAEILRAWQETTEAKTRP